MTFTADDITTALRSDPKYRYSVYGDSSWGEDSWDTDETDWFYSGGDVGGIGSFVVESRWNLGDGHECGVILKHVESGRLFRKTGYYSSWDGDTWDGSLEEVKPVKVKVTRYSTLDDSRVYENPTIERKK